LQPPFVSTHLSIPHNFKHNIRDIRSAFYTSTTRNDGAKTN
jgi:hypothetical protein